MEELLDIVDEAGNPTGRTARRTDIHALGLLHRTSHLWLVRRRGGRVEILLQHRSPQKEAYPDCYDISSAGHIPAGSGFAESAIRELHEELGIEASEEELILCGRRRFIYRESHGGRPYVDNQISNVYIMWRDVPPEQMALQAEEVDGVRWMAFDELVQAVAGNTIRHCIAGEELEILARALNGQRQEAPAGDCESE